MKESIFGINYKIFALFILLLLLNLRVILAAPLAKHCIDYSANDATLFFNNNTNGKIEITISDSYRKDELLFKISKCDEGEKLKFVCTNKNILLNPFYSYDRKVWKSIEGKNGKYNSHEFEFITQKSKVFIALVPEAKKVTDSSRNILEYSYDKLAKYIDSIRVLPEIVSEKLDNSVQGRDIYKFTITDRNVSDEHKKHVWFNFRVHGDEATQSYVLEGIIEYLLSGSNESKEFLARTVYHIVPLINPDGAFNNERENANGIDLNRNWSSPDTVFEEQPEVATVHNAINNVISGKGNKISHVVDFHGWHRAEDGGFRSHYNAGNCSVDKGYYNEQKSYVDLIKKNDSWQSYWEYTPGKITMARIALYKEHGVSIMTQEYPSAYRYDSSQVTSEQFRQQGVENLKSIDRYVFPLTFNDASGNSVSNYYKNDLIYFTCDDYDAGIASKYKEDICTVTVYTASGDIEDIVLSETGDTTGIFTSSEGISFENGSVVNGDGVVQITDMSELCIAVYQDSDYDDGVSWDYVTLHDGETKNLDNKNNVEKLLIKTIDNATELQININGIKCYQDISVSIVSLNGRTIKKINYENSLNGKMKIKKDKSLARGLYICSINGININKQFPLFIK